MMDHREIQELLPAYLDQELGIPDALAVERHLASCAECQREYAQQRMVSTLLRKDSLSFGAPAHLAKNISAALPPERLPLFNRFRFLKVNWLNAGAALASLMVAAWSIGLYLSLPSAQERLAAEVTSSHVRSLQADHLSDVASSDQHTVKPWFNGKLNFSPPVADLAAQGFPLVGGRLDYLDGHPVAALIYRHGQHPINLYAWPSSEKEAAPQTSDRQGYHLVRWAQDGMAYWTVSDLAPDELENFVQRLRAALRK